MYRATPPDAIREPSCGGASCRCKWNARLLVACNLPVGDLARFAAVQQGGSAPCTVKEFGARLWDRTVAAGSNCEPGARAVYCCFRKQAHRLMNGRTDFCTPQEGVHCLQISRRNRRLRDSSQLWVCVAAAVVRGINMSLIRQHMHAPRLPPTVSRHLAEYAAESDTATVLFHRDQSVLSLSQSTLTRSHHHANDRY